jgi:hypothetical protein
MRLYDKLAYFVLWYARYQYLRTMVLNILRRLLMMCTCCLEFVDDIHNRSAISLQVLSFWAEVMCDQFRAEPRTTAFL